MAAGHHDRRKGVGAACRKDDLSAAAVGRRARRNSVAFHQHDRLVADRAELLRLWRDSKAPLRASISFVLLTMCRLKHRKEVQIQARAGASLSDRFAAFPRKKNLARSSSGRGAIGRIDGHFDLWPRSIIRPTISSSISSLWIRARPITSLPIATAPMPSAPIASAPTAIAPTELAPIAVRRTATRCRFVDLAIMSFSTGLPLCIRDSHSGSLYPFPPGTTNSFSRGVCVTNSRMYSAPAWHVSGCGPDFSESP